MWTIAWRGGGQSPEVSSLSLQFLEKSLPFLYNYNFHSRNPWCWYRGNPLVLIGEVFRKKNIFGLILRLVSPDTHLYVFSLALALPLIVNKETLHSCDHISRSWSMMRTCPVCVFTTQNWRCLSEFGRPWQTVVHDKPSFSRCTVWFHPFSFPDGSRNTSKDRSLKSRSVRLDVRCFLQCQCAPTQPRMSVVEETLPNWEESRHLETVWGLESKGTLGQSRAHCCPCPSASPDTWGATTTVQNGSIFHKSLYLPTSRRSKKLTFFLSLLCGRM